jgi:hypothetical protein
MQRCIKDHYEILIQHHNQWLDYQQKHHVYPEFLLSLIAHPGKTKEMKILKAKKSFT